MVCDPKVGNGAVTIGSQLNAHPPILKYMCLLSVIFCPYDDDDDALFYFWGSQPVENHRIAFLTVDVVVLTQRYSAGCRTI